MTGNFSRRRCSGRKRITTKTEDVHLVRHMKIEVARGHEPNINEIKELCGLKKISNRTVSRRLKESNGLKNVLKKKKPFVSTVNRLKR
jgi:hypothetical protein